jgi:hypothetical protein
VTDIGHPAGRYAQPARPPLAADAVAKATFVPPLSTIKSVTNWAKLGQFPRWIKLGGGDRQAVHLSAACRDKKPSREKVSFTSTRNFATFGRMKILAAWIGTADLRAAEHEDESEVGPIAQADD